MSVTAIRVMYGRALKCTVCGTVVDVIEIDLTAERADHWIPEDEYVCGEHLVSVNTRMPPWRYGASNKPVAAADVKQYVETAFPQQEARAA